MLLTRVCRSTLVPQTRHLFKLPSVTKPQLTKIQNVRLFSNEGRSTFTRSAKRRAPSVTESAMAPAGETAFNIGKGAVAGAAFVGVGALCFYGLGLSSSTGAIDKAGYVILQLILKSFVLGFFFFLTKNFYVLLDYGPNTLKTV